MHYLFLLFCVIVFTTLEFVNLQYFNVILNLKRKTNLAATIFILSLYGIGLTVSYFNYSAFSKPILAIIFLLTLAYRFIAFPIILKKFNKKILFLTLSFYVLPYIFENIARYFISFKIKYFETVASSIMLIALMGILLYIIKKKDWYFSIQSAVFSVKFTSYIIIAVFMYFNSAFVYFVFTPNFNDKFIIFGTILNIPVIIFLIFKISISSKRYEETSIILEKQLENQAEYYEKINNIYSEFRSFRHDYKNHILCIRNLIADNNIDEAVSYINEISMTVDNKHKYYDTGNTMINALLTDKSEKSAFSNTQIVFSGVIPSSGIKNVDLCTIFANALDNAIEACEKDTSNGSKCISIDSNLKQGYYFLNICNPFFENIIHDELGNISTSKPDKEYHGFGINNIKKTVKKYNGETSIQKENNIFKLSINLNIFNNQNQIH